MEEMRRENEEMEIDLLEIAHLLWRKAWAILLCLIIGAALVGSYTKFLVTPQYSASSMIYVLTKTTTVTSITDLQIGTQLISDFMTLTTSRPVVEDVIEDMDLDTTYEKLKEKITVNNPTDTRILEITATDPDPKMARDISNAMAKATVERISEVMDTEKPNIVEDAVTPTIPSSPSLVKNTAIGALLGALLAIAVIVIRHLMDDTIKTEEDVKKYLELNVLAAVPLEKGSSKKRKSA